MGHSRLKLAPAILGVVFLGALMIGAQPSISSFAGSNDTAGVGADLPHLLGDTDCNDDVDAVDALQALRSVADIQPQAHCAPLGDVNCDYSLTAVDALGILRYVAQLPPIQAAPACPNIASASMRILTIDKFGDGTVASFSNEITCDDACTIRSFALPDGLGLTFDAVPGPGSTFSHWSNCDSPVGNNCEVTFDADKTVLATFAFDEVIIPATTKVLDDATMALLLRVEGDTYYFDAAATAVAAVQPGDVMVSGSGEGVLRKVVSVTADASEIAVLTEAASLEDAIEKSYAWGERKKQQFSPRKIGIAFDVLQQKGWIGNGAGEPG